MKRNRKVLLVLMGILVLLQLVPSDRNENGDPGHAIFVRTFNVPENVGQILSTSCFDCHSNTTNYPWYTKIQPVGWWMGMHIKEGKSELNFDEFQSYTHRRQLSKLKSMASSIEDKSMPLPSYTFAHQNAKPSEKEQKIMTDWISRTLDSLEQNSNQ